LEAKAASACASAVRAGHPVSAAAASITEDALPAAHAQPNSTASNHFSLHITAQMPHSHSSTQANFAHPKFHSSEVQICLHVHLL